MILLNVPRFGRISRFSTLCALAGLCALSFALGCNRGSRSTPAATVSLSGTIHDAAAAGDLTLVKAFLKSNPSLLDSKDKLGETPLFKAAQEGHKDVVAFLLGSGAAVDAKCGHDNSTPLIGAATGPHQGAPNAGHGDVVEVLLANKADIEATNSQGWTPLIVASSIDNKPVAEALLAHNARVDAKNGEGETPLHLAAFWGHTDIAKLLIGHGAKVDVRNRHGMTPLHNAALWDRTEIVEFLLANKANINAEDNAGQTPLRLAMSTGYKQVAALLRQRGGRY